MSRGWGASLMLRRKAKTEPVDEQLLFEAMNDGCIASLSSGPKTA